VTFVLKICSSCIKVDKGVYYHAGNVLYCTGEGVHWHNINEGVSVDDDFALLHVIVMLLLDCVIYACIAWYVEAVFPGEYGIPRPFYFPLMVRICRQVVTCSMRSVSCYTHLSIALWQKLLKG